MKLLNWILGLGSSAALVMVILQYRTVAGLRAESVHLVVATNVVIAPNSKPNEPEATELARLREENRDLLKLRNEAQQLRQQLKESASIQLQNEQLRAMATNKIAWINPAQSKEGFIAKAALADVGASTPKPPFRPIFGRCVREILSAFDSFLHKWE